MGRRVRICNASNIFTKQLLDAFQSYTLIFTRQLCRAANRWPIHAIRRQLTDGKFHKFCFYNVWRIRFCQT